MANSQKLSALRRQAANISARAQKLQRQWNEGQSIPDPKHEPVSLHLAHYTSLEAIVSMLQARTGGLRLSDTSTMNDPEEGRTTFESKFMSHVLEEELGEDSWVWNRYGTAKVCCFVGIECARDRIIDAGDDLLFWRLYGNDCRGVSIKMPTLLSKELVDDSIIERVTYADELPPQMDLSEFSTFLKDLEKLHSRALDAGLWSKICPDLLIACDSLLKQRFLRKRLHYKMEEEYRAVAFLSEDNEDDGRCSTHGKHVQYGRVRQYIQIPELNCDSILETGSQITIGSNVPEPDNVRDSLRELVEGSAEIPSAVAIRVSKILYHPR